MCIPNSEKGQDFPFEGSKRIEKRKEEEGEGAGSRFLSGNLHVKKHSGKTVPAGNWSLIGSEVERDQLALVSQGKGGCIRQKWKKRQGLAWGAGSVPVQKKTSGLVLIRCTEAL